MLTKNIFKCIFLTARLIRLIFFVFALKNIVILLEPMFFDILAFPPDPKTKFSHQMDSFSPNLFCKCGLMLLPALRIHKKAAVQCSQADAHFFILMTLFHLLLIFVGKLT